MRPVPLVEEVVAVDLAIVVEIIFPTRLIKILEQPLPRTVRVVSQLTALLLVAPSGDERARIVMLISVGRGCSSAIHLSSCIARLLSPFAQTEI